jgi:hypothetical protein
MFSHAALPHTATTYRMTDRGGRQVSGALLPPAPLAPVDLRSANRTISGEWWLMIIVLLCVIRRSVIAKISAPT